MKLLGTAILSLAMFASGSTDSCAQAPQSASGIQQVTTTVQVGNDGLTVEQRNVRDRLAMDNKPGSIKHLYIISAYSGQVILYSTVRGKVTSSGKRLTPTSVIGNTTNSGFTVPQLGNQTTTEVLEDDGTYGSSVDYIYWWDVNGRYFQIYPNGGEIIMISDQPVPVKSVTINLEERKE